MGCANRSVRSLFVNGAPRPVGYMSQLRFHPRVRQGMHVARSLARAFAFYRTLHEDRRAPFYLLSVVAGNRAAQRLLASGLSGFPRMRPAGSLVTHAIHLGRPRRPLPLPPGLRLEQGTAALLPEILACLERNGRRRQLAPVWTAETLCRPEHTPGLAVEDFVVALSGGRVVGCLAAWDQRAVKQTIVRGYGGALARWRRLLNLLSPLGGWPELPEPGTELRSCFASHRAVDGDDRKVFGALLSALYERTRERGCRYLVIGLDAADPWRSVVGGYRTFPYWSQLYLAAWEDGEAAAAEVDGRLPGLEAAIL